MRILMAVPKYPFPVAGGLERQAHELAQALIRRGHEIRAISSRFDPRQNTVDLIDGVRAYRLNWVEFKLARFLLFPFGLARIMLLLRRDTDLVHVHNTSWFGAFITLFAKALRLPVITKLPNSGDFGVAAMRRQRFGFLRVALLKTSDAIIAMTPESLAELSSIGYPAARVLKVTNGISLLPANPPVPRLIPPRTLNAVFVGRLSAEKGLADLLHAWATVKARASRAVVLRLIGAGPQEGELRSLAANLDLGESVEFLGHREDVPAELAKADLFVLASYAEGNSNAILEAMRAGLPIVSTRLGGAPIQVGSEGERCLCAPGDQQAIAACILELIEDEPLRLRIGAAMRARIETLFDINRIAAVYEKAYELLVSGRQEQIGQINRDMILEREQLSPPCAE
jgi:glycosyltransferase involved in cell wall biosynthesis